MILFIIILSIIIIVFGGWFVFGKGIKIPLLFILFQILKNISDSSVVLEKKNRTIWIEFGLNFQFSDIILNIKIGF